MCWKYILATICVCILSSAGPLSAQDAYLARIYGDGVHSYFRNDTSTAKSRFDTAINHGSRDPRAYYFRAILELESGNSATAQSDIRTGAKYELEGRGTYDVWNALARVQGPHRVKFEGLRDEALLALRKQSVTDRYPLDFPDDRDAESLRPPADPYRTELEPNVPSIMGDDPFMDDEEPPAAPTEDDEDDEAADELEDDIEELEDDPFAAAEPAAEMDQAQPEVDSDDPFAEEATSAEGDPFADDMSADEAPADDDPFADEMDADEMDADEMDADDPSADDPFSDDAVDEAPADDDPFGDDAMDDDSRDAPEEPPENDEDPFGEDAMGDELPEADESPAEGAGDADDPFGDDADDPFGDIFE